MFKNVSKWVKIALQNLCKNSIPLPSYMQKKKLSEKKMVKTKVVDNFMYFFLFLTKSEKCGFKSQKCLAKYWPESFFDQNGLFAIKHLYESFAHENLF